MTKQNNRPKLRFPEFEEHWEEIKLGELFSNRRQKGNDSIPIFSVTQDRGLVSRDSLDRKMQNDAKSEDNLLVEQNDLVYNMMRMWQGAVGMANQTCMVSPAYVVLKPSKNANSLFFIYFFQKTRSLYLFTSYSYGLTSDRLRLYYKDFADIKLSVPALPEQTKIANFLTAVDDKISQLKKKKELLEQYKKGVMQKIFSQELRFKDENGADFPEWEETAFGELFTFRSTNSFSRDNLNFEEGEVKNIHYGDIHTKFKSHFDITNESVPFVNKEIPLNKLFEEVYCKDGDLIIADASEDYADIGKAIEIVNLNNEKVIAGLHTLHARPNLKKLTIGFSGHLMKSESIRLQIKTQSQGTKVLSITTGRLASIKIGLPCTNEQTKIADFLSAIDEKINHCGQEIAGMERWKKGLLQGMFV